MYIEKGLMLDTLACQKACATPPQNQRHKHDKLINNIYHVFIEAEGI